MFKKGMKLSTVKEKMKRFSWWKFRREIHFNNEQSNLIYYCGADTLCFWFQNGQLMSGSHLNF